MPLRSLLRADNAVSVEIGYILNLVILLIITGSIAGVFYLYADSSSQQAMRAGFTDLGSQIARDITNMNITSEPSSNISISTKRNIPLTIGGRGYRINLSAAPGRMASVNISDGSFSAYETVTELNTIDAGVNASGTVYSGSGEMIINMTKNSSGTWFQIK
jgi:hypothetical protein